ncbi:MAG: hypothetical protein ACOY9J_08695 [Pseudomonadota bacterium]
MKRTKYVLDVTACHLPWWPADYPKVVPVMAPGKYGRDFDVVEDGIPGHAKQQMRQAIYERQPAETRDLIKPDIAPGFDYGQMPAGAVIRPQREEEAQATP